MTISPCPACMGGDHSRHVANWGTRPEGVIDGEYCYCTGDCKERYDRWLEEFKYGLGDPNSPRRSYLSRSILQTLAALERNETITTDPSEKFKCCGMDRDDDGYCVNRPYHPIYVEFNSSYR